MSLSRSSNPAAASDPRADAIRDLCRWCDVAERLPLLPPSAKSRGVYLLGIDRVLANTGSFERFKDFFPQRPSAIPWYPMSEFLERLTVGGALLAGPERIHQGMFEIGRGNAVTFAESLLGRVLIRLLDRDPKRLLKQGIAGRRQGNTHGHWELELPSDHEAVVTMTEEYSYIESYLLGAAQGTFDAIGVSVRAEAILKDRFNGKHLLQW
ncbi:MAG TPA: TIGR02265 family protein [Polyangiaceae bacterium]|nr:TIGR02265 family protein [Polyangiaceae bacterium]